MLSQLVSHDFGRADQASSGLCWSSAVYSMEYLVPLGGPGVALPVHRADEKVLKWKRYMYLDHGGLHCTCPPYRFTGKPANQEEDIGSCTS